MNNDTEKITKLQNALCCLIGPPPLNSIQWKDAMIFFSCISNAFMASLSCHAYELFQPEKLKSKASITKINYKYYLNLIEQDFVWPVSPLQ
jgi:hypothetical protein